MACSSLYILVIDRIVYCDQKQSLRVSFARHITIYLGPKGCNANAMQSTVMLHRPYLQLSAIRFVAAPSDEYASAQAGDSCARVFLDNFDPSTDISLQSVSSIMQQCFWLSWVLLFNLRKVLLEIKVRV